MPTKIKLLTISVLVEKGESLLEFGNLFFGKLISHGGSINNLIANELVFVLCAFKCWAKQRKGESLKVPITAIFRRE